MLAVVRRLDHSALAPNATANSWRKGTLMVLCVSSEIFFFSLSVTHYGSHPEGYTLDNTPTFCQNFLGTFPFHNFSPRFSFLCKNNKRFNESIRFTFILLNKQDLRWNKLGFLIKAFYRLLIKEPATTNSTGLIIINQNNPRRETNSQSELTEYLLMSERCRTEGRSLVQEKIRQIELAFEKYADDRKRLIMLI